MNREHFLLYECCRLVHGTSYGVIMDLQRNEYIEIPNLLYEVLSNDLKKYSIEHLKLKYNNELNEGIDKYIQYLINEEYGFITTEPFLFPNLNLDFHSPFKLESSIICYNNKSKYSLKNVILELEDLGVQTIQIRLFDIYIDDLICSLMKMFNESSIKIFEIYIEYHKNIDFVRLKKLMNSNMRVSIIIHSSPNNKKLNIEGNREILLVQQIINEKSKDIYDLKLLTCNTKFFCEANNFNVGLNKKICIDSVGNIKNHISHKKSYGNIQKMKLSEVLLSKDFKQKWYIRNDLIEKCKDCQFRYMCLSNSDIETKNGKYYKINYCDHEL